VQPYELLAGDSQQLERVGVAQIILDEERDPRQVVERADVMERFDARLPQALGAERLTGDNASDRLAQALELQAP
jgi:hypothetical protein